MNVRRVLPWLAAGAVAALALATWWWRGQQPPEPLRHAASSSLAIALSVVPPKPSAAPPAPAALPSESASWVKVDARSTESCPPDMLLVEGRFCPFVGHRCKRWLQRGHDRCSVYDEHEICEGRLRRLKFCMDRYEYPNQAGVYPVVMVSYVEAEKACLAEHKRMCLESEWNFACEGEQRFPYPYGYERDASKCNIDKRPQLPDFEAFSNPRQIAEEVSRLDQRVRSGELSECVSPFGVHDMTGNVDEWVRNESGKPDISGLKGGYFGPIRARCRPMTTDHNRWFRFYQVGFRCCADPKAGAAD